MPLRVAIFGQAAFGRDVAARVAASGFEVVGVYAPPEGRRPDPLAELAETEGWPLFRHKRFRRRGEAIPELVSEYHALGAELNLMPFTTVILPPEIVEAPAHGSLCFHPSLLPAFRGGNALAWQIILGAEETGVTVFRPDEGVDTGPIVVQRGGIAIDALDTTASLYFEKLYPVGLEAIDEAVQAVAAGRADLRVQPEEGASFQGLVGERESAIDWSLSGERVDRLIRGCDPQPGAHARLEGETVRLYSSHFRSGQETSAPGTVLGSEGEALLLSAHGGVLEVGKIRRDGDSKKPAVHGGLRPGQCLGSA